MGSITTESGYRFDHVRRCRKCGRKPRVRTGYVGFDDGTGPFVVMCDHGTPLEDQPEGQMDLMMSRSWYKTRAAANWNRMMREYNPTHKGEGR